MAEEAVEAAALEVGKEFISRGAEIVITLSEDMARAVTKAVKTSGIKVAKKTMQKIDERINSGEMHVKRLYRVGDGNLQQMEIDESCIEQVKANLKDQGVSFAVEENSKGELFLYFQGKDFDHVSHVVTQTIEDLGLTSEEQITHDQTQEEEPPSTQEQETERQLDTAQSMPPSYPPENEPTRGTAQSHPADEINPPAARNPLSEEYVPTPEEAEYFEAAGFEAKTPSKELDHNEHEHTKIDMHSFHENRSDEQDNDNGTIIEHEPATEQITDHDDTPQIPLAKRLAAQNAGMDEPEHTESASMNSVHYPSDNSSVSADASNGQDVYDTDVDAQQRDNVIDTSTETRSQTIKGKKTKKASIKQRLRAEINNRAQQKQLAMKSHAALDHGQPKRSGRGK